VYRLKNALYRLKQALRAWYSQIDGHFDEKCFLKSKNEPTLLVKRQGVDDILIALYVDILCLPKTMKE
jgi:hypothetical protein